MPKKGNELMKMTGKILLLSAGRWSMEADPKNNQPARSGVSLEYVPEVPPTIKPNERGVQVVKATVDEAIWSNLSAVPGYYEAEFAMTIETQTKYGKTSKVQVVKPVLLNYIGQLTMQPAQPGPVPKVP